MTYKLKLPLKVTDKKIVVTLPYGDKTYAKTYALLGWSIKIHNGSDFAYSASAEYNYGKDIISASNGRVVKVWFDTPTNSKGNGVEVQTEPFDCPDGKRRILSIIYWHLSSVNVVPGQEVRVGDKLGEMGNSGTVFGTSISAKSGSHLHFMVYPILVETWQVEFPNNGANGAVDPMLWLEPWESDIIPPITKDLRFGMNDKEVIILKRKLVKLGFLSPAVTNLTEYYGEQTRRAVLRFQRQNKVCVLCLENGKKVGLNTRNKLNI